MERLQVKLFGDFRILRGDENIIYSLGDSRKKVALLNCLALNRRRAVTAEELFSSVWPNEGNVNPESALKTLVSRLRKDLSRYGLSELIATRAHGYMWNPDIDCYFDVEEFEELCSGLSDAQELDGETDGSFKRVLALYEGDVSGAAGDGVKRAAKIAHYRDLYLNAVYRYISLLKNGERLEEVCSVCRSALEKDAFDSLLNLELISALSALGRRNDALAQYENTLELHGFELHETAKGDMEQIYDRIANDRKSSDDDMKRIISELTQEDDDNDAFVCEYSLFKHIYGLNRRNFSRFNIPVFLSIVTVSTVSEKTPDPLLLHDATEDLLGIMKKDLRKGDAIARYSPSQFAVLLPSVSHETGTNVMQRIKSAFYKTRRDSRFVLTYKLSPVERSAQ